MKIENIEKYNELMTEKTAVIDFFAEWCGPCRMLTPIIEELSHSHPEYNLYKLDIDNFSDLAEKHNVQAVPTIIFFKNGVEVDRVSGFVPAETLEERILKNR